MSLGGSMNTAVSALNAQSAAIAMISENLANSSTVGYKTVNASFATIMSGQSTSKSSSGGVTSYARQYVNVQGQIEATSTTTDMAIDGNGLFVVCYGDDASDQYYTRDGEFVEDVNGYLTLNNKYYLMGWKVSDDGTFTTTNSSDLEMIDLSKFSTKAKATSSYELSQNLPADATVSAAYTTSLSFYNSLGNNESIDAVWTKTGANTWTVDLSDPTDTTTATTSPSTFTFTFNGDGELVSTDPSDTTLSVTGWDDGATDSAITLDFSGMTQLSSGLTTPSIGSVTATQDGYAMGSLTGVTVGTDGVITANYSNGMTMPIYQVAMATFNNYNGLSLKSDNVYQATDVSGVANVVTAGTNGAGKIDGQALESSTTDTAGQFALMIVAQQAYSAASQVISTSKQMFDDLIQAAR